jgi:hypothetical protein
MKIQVKSYTEKTWALKHEKGWIIAASGQSPLVSENKKLLEFLSENINKKEPGQRGFALDEPYATLYFTLSWLNAIEEGKDPLSGDSEWEISCDPVFHLQPGPPMIQIQLEAFAPIFNWFEEIGAEQVDLPLIYAGSHEELEELKNDPSFRIGKKNSQAILKQWNSLTDNERAVAYFLQHQISRFEHSLCAALLFIKGKLTNDQFAQTCCAAECISPEMADVSKKEYNQAIKHFKD